MLIHDLLDSLVKGIAVTGAALAALYLAGMVH